MCEVSSNTRLSVTKLKQNLVPTLSNVLPSVPRTSRKEFEMVFQVTDMVIERFNSK